MFCVLVASGCKGVLLVRHPSRCAGGAEFFPCLDAGNFSHSKWKQELRNYNANWYKLQFNVITEELLEDSLADWLRWLLSTRVSNIKNLWFSGRMGRSQQMHWASLSRCWVDDVDVMKKCHVHEDISSQFRLQCFMRMSRGLRWAHENKPYLSHLRNISKKKPFKHVRCNSEVGPRLTLGGYEEKMMILLQSTYCS